LKTFAQQIPQLFFCGMNRPAYILAIDQGTTSSRAIVFDHNGNAVAKAQKELPQIYPANGLVEHDPEQIWKTTCAVSRQALSASGGNVTAVGIANQRETIVVWDRATGVPIHNAIVWQDRRTAETCTQLRDQNLEGWVSERTGLLLDSYFTATKLRWLLDHVDGARQKAEQGQLAAGTIDSFLLWRLTGGQVHATDATNASRTLLFNIHSQQWDPDLLVLFDIPGAILPEVKNSADDYGYTSTEVFGSAIPILGIAGDQHAALIGQACVHMGMTKSTYGTGCFTLLNTGTQAIASSHRLLTTISYRIEGKVHYALEGSIFNAGTTVQWLRDSLGVIESAAETANQAKASKNRSDVMFVPAFTGLGAPHWDPHARGTIYGLTRDSGPAELARAALEAVGYQSAELLDAMVDDGAATITKLRVDGGMAKNDWMLQFLANITGVVVERPTVIETTALGAARLAALGAGILKSLEDVAEHWQLERRFYPQMSSAERYTLVSRWTRAVQNTRSFGAPR
jgi:glycerol kinase